MNAMYGKSAYPRGAYNYPWIRRQFRLGVLWIILWELLAFVNSATIIGAIFAIAIGIPLWIIAMDWDNQ